tara:strand:+ start:251 stop:685 length:435 start_codon:yes stop_codon:yes gene_type:complete
MAGNPYQNLIMSGFNQGRPPMGGNRSGSSQGYGYPIPKDPSHPNHPDYNPHMPRIPTLLEHWQHRDEIEQFGRGVKEWLQGKPAIPGSQATPPPTQQDPPPNDGGINPLLLDPFSNPNVYPRIPGHWWLNDPNSPLLQPWSPTL